MRRPPMTPFRVSSNILLPSFYPPYWEPCNLETKAGSPLPHRGDCSSAADNSPFPPPPPPLPPLSNPLLPSSSEEGKLPPVDPVMLCPEREPSLQCLTSNQGLLRLCGVEGVFLVFGG